MTPNPTGRELVEGLVEQVLVGPEVLQELIQAAYIAGCEDVHANFQEDNDPNFVEAAYDYVASLDFTDTTKPDRSAARISQLEARVAELEREREEQGSSNASRAAQGTTALPPPSAEPSAGQGMFSFVPGQQYEFRFRNYRGEDETRHVIFQGSNYGANSYYPTPQWFLCCWDVERGEPRSFLLSNIDVGTLAATGPQPRIASEAEPSAAGA